MGNNNSTAQPVQRQVVQPLPGVNVDVPPQGSPASRPPPGTPYPANSVNNIIGVDRRVLKEEYSPRELKQGDLQNESWQSIISTPVYVSLSGAGAGVATHKKIERVPGTNVLTEYLAVYLMFPLPSEIAIREAEEQILFEVPKYIAGIQIVKPLKMVVESYWPKQDTIFVITDAGTRMNMNLTKAKAVDWWNPVTQQLNAIKIALAALMRDRPGQTIKELSFTQVAATPADYGESEDDYQKRLRNNNNSNSNAQNMTLKTRLESQKTKRMGPPTDDQIQEAFKKENSQYTENLVFSDPSGHVVTAQELKEQQSKNQKLTPGEGQDDTENASMADATKQDNAKIGASFHGGGGGGGHFGGGGGHFGGGGGGGHFGGGGRFGGGGVRFGGGVGFGGGRPYRGGFGGRRGYNIVRYGGRRGYWYNGGFIPIPIGYLGSTYYLDDPYYYGYGGGYDPYYSDAGPYYGGGGGLLNVALGTKMNVGVPQNIASLFR